MYKSVIMALELLEKQIKSDNNTPKEYQFYMIQGLNIAKDFIQDTYEEAVREYPNETVEDLVEDIINYHGSYLTIESLECMIKELKEVYDYEE